MPTKIEISEFSEIILNRAHQKKLSIMDSVIDYCNETTMEVDVASTLLSPAVKLKIREEAQELNLLKRTSKLPV
jgi:hypothetical protein